MWSLLELVWAVICLVGCWFLSGWYEEDLPVDIMFCGGCGRRLRPARVVVDDFGQHVVQWHQCCCSWGVSWQ